MMQWLQKNWQWLTPLGSAVVVIAAIWGIAVSDFQLPPASARVEKATKLRRIDTYTINTPKGDIVVTELRTGTEFTRLLQMPDGHTIAEAGWTNHWGEDQVRIIGEAKSND